MKTKETHRVADRVHLQFMDDDGKDIYPGGRYVDISKWEADPHAVIAEVSEYLASQPAPAEVIMSKVDPVVMTETQIGEKQTEIRLQKEAEIKAKADAEEKAEADAKAKVKADLEASNVRANEAKDKNK